MSLLTFAFAPPCILHVLRRNAPKCIFIKPRAQNRLHVLLSIYKTVILLDSGNQFACCLASVHKFVHHDLLTYIRPAALTTNAFWTKDQGPGLPVVDVFFFPLCYLYCSTIRLIAKTTVINFFILYLYREWSIIVPYNCIPASFIVFDTHKQNLQYNRFYRYLIIYNMNNKKKMNGELHLLMLCGCLWIFLIILNSFFPHRAKIYWLLSLKSKLCRDNFFEEYSK